MAETGARARRVFNGTFGEVWVDGFKHADVKALQAKVEFDKVKMNFAGDFVTESMPVSASITGSVTIWHADSSLLEGAEDALAGLDVRHTLISRLNDPDVPGAEDIVLTGVSYDSITLADWKLASKGEVTLAFTATGQRVVQKSN